VVVISDGLWRRLGTPPDILSKTISVDGEARPVVGDRSTRGCAGQSNSPAPPQVFRHEL